MGNYFKSVRPVCLCSVLLPAEMQEKLSERFHIIGLAPDDDLAAPVRCHPDMICSVIAGKIIFPFAYALKNHALVDEIAHYSGYSVVLSDAPRSAVYPADVGLNAAVGKDFVLCRKDSTAPELTGAAHDSDKRVINVRQGYAGCSCIVADNAVLTSDRGIFDTLSAKRLSAEGVDVCFADNSGIALPGYDVGFIGGCGGFFDGTLYFCGNFDLLPCRETIRNFAARHGFDLCKLSDTTLTDYGGLKILPKIY